MTALHDYAGCCHILTRIGHKYTCVPPSWTSSLPPFSCMFTFHDAVLCFPKADCEVCCSPSRAGVFQSLHTSGNNRGAVWLLQFRSFRTWAVIAHCEFLFAFFWLVMKVKNVSHTYGLWDVFFWERTIQTSCQYLTIPAFSEKAMAPHSSTLAWKIPWMEEPGRLQSMGSQRVGHDWATSLSLFTFMHWRRKWQPTPVFLPGESQGRGSLVGCRLWGCTESDTTEAT